MEIFHKKYHTLLIATKIQLEILYLNLIVIIL